MTTTLGVYLSVICSLNLMPLPGNYLSAVIHCRLTGSGQPIKCLKQPSAADLKVDRVKADNHNRHIRIRRKEYVFVDEICIGWFLRQNF